jgi:methylenetetrahydrofolate reductase (NADPH)
MPQAHLDDCIASGARLLMVEVSPPASGDAEAVRAWARQYAGKVHALGVSDNREGVRMSALAAASLIAAEGAEPVLHVVTRDRNRIALASEALGARALGVRNMLCTTGTHQTLGACGSARNVFDVDSVQLLQMYAGNGNGASFCLGAAASPFADPMELQIMKLAKKVAVGAKFLITQPVFDVERFEAWWTEITRRGLHEKTAILAGIYPLVDAERAKAYAATRPSPMIPAAVLERLTSGSDQAAQRAAGIEIAVQTIKRLSPLEGLRGFEIRSDGEHDATLEVIDKAGLASS